MPINMPVGKSWVYFCSHFGSGFSAGDETHTIAGVLFNGTQPRVVQIDGFVIDAVPEGLMLVVSSRDVPGVIGHSAVPSPGHRG